MKKVIRYDRRGQVIPKPANRDCGICGKPVMYSSTATDALCDKCAPDNGLCKQCGGDVDLTFREGSYPFLQVRE